MKLNIITAILVILGSLMIIVGSILEIREMLIDHYCYELTPYEKRFKNICKKYMEGK